MTERTGLVAPAGTGFIADAMLGRLARWLRLAGCDVLYDARLDDADLVRLSRQTGRVLLTRDRQLARRKSVRAALVESDRAEEQLTQVFLQFPAAAGRQPRCASCNGELLMVDRAQVEGEVPAFVWVNHDWFHRCVACGHIYWQGTHWRRIDAALALAVGVGRDSERADAAAI